MKTYHHVASLSVNDPGGIAVRQGPRRRLEDDFLILDGEIPFSDVAGSYADAIGDDQIVLCC